MCGGASCFFDDARNYTHPGPGLDIFTLDLLLYKRVPPDNVAGKHRRYAANKLGRAQ